MGRPRKQTVDYFPHFVSTDSKTKFILEQTWGNDGYAFWFKLLELLGRSDGHCYDCSDVASTKYLSALTRTSDSTTEEILNTLADLGNIDRELWKEHRLIWCQSFVDNLQDVYSKRTAVIPQKPVLDHKKEQQEKKADEKPKKRKSILAAEQQELFEKFYAVYPKKVDRATAERAWAKIEPTPDEEITQRVIKAVEAAKKHDNRFREKQYIPNPASWLNAKGYLNEYDEGGANRENRTDEYAGHRREFRGSCGFMGQG